MPTDFADRITANDRALTVFLEDLKDKKYQIPTFQREVVWDKDNVKRLWDSIYKYYPIGSILIWKTDVELHMHREIGGHQIGEGLNVSEFQYILDGQQRSTSLFTSLYGGEIEGQPGFDPKLYVDLTVEDFDEEKDNVSEEDVIRNRFLFKNEFTSDGGRITKNVKREERFEEGLIVPLEEIKNNPRSIHRKLSEKGFEEFGSVREQLREFKAILDNYQMALIELREIEVKEVCQIFERINQEGKELDIFDIVVAKTYSPPSDGNGGFYLREIIEDFRGELLDKKSEFGHLSHRNFLEMLAILIYRTIEGSGVSNITETYLERIQREHIEQVMDDTKQAAMDTFGFLDNHLNLPGPKIIPTKYFYPTLVRYFNKVENPDYNLLEKFFWFYSFHATENLRNSSNMKDAVKFLENYVDGEVQQFDQFVIDRDHLRSASYKNRGRISRAILSLFARENPSDWLQPEQSVLESVYYRLKDTPNLHHIFPQDFVDNHLDSTQLKHSMMNIAYITRDTNMEVLNKNPIEYIQEIGLDKMERVREEHYLPVELLEWATENKLPDNPLEIFVEKRIDLIIEKLRQKLQGIKFEVIDTGRE